MVQINFGQREVSCKVVFYGPGMSGKTTNLEIIHKKAPKDAVGEMVSIATETDRTLYFDFLPLDLGTVAGMRTKFQLYTVPGQIYYNATRKLVLQGVDGVIFVADSSPDKMAENLESLQNLRDNLAEMSLTTDDIPLVLQYNKRDLPNALSVADINAQLNPMGVPVFEGVAREGKGVFATLKEISRLVIEKLNKEHAPASNRRRTSTSLTPPNAQPPMPPPGQPTPVRPAPVAQMVTPRQQPAPPAQPAQRPQQQPPAQRPQQPPPQQAARPTAPPPQALPPARPPMPAQPTPSRGVPQIPQAAQPIANDPRDKHLAKAKPPSLENAKQQTGGKVNLGATDPSLKRYQEASRPGGGGVKTLLIVLIGLMVLVILAILAIIYVPAVRGILPQDIQRQLMGSSAAPVANPVIPTAPVATPVTPVANPAAPIPDPAPTATPTPAPIPAAAIPAPETAPAVPAPADTKPAEPKPVEPKPADAATDASVKIPTPAAPAAAGEGTNGK